MNINESLRLLEFRRTELSRAVWLPMILVGRWRVSYNLTLDAKAVRPAEFSLVFLPL